MQKTTGNTYQLTAIDDAILQIVHTYHYVTCEQIVRLRYSKKSVATCQVRLKSLFDAGYLDRQRLPSTSTGNTSYVYSLTAKGARVVTDATEREIDARQRKEALQYPFLAHVLDLNSFLITASLLPRCVPALELAAMQHDLDLKKTPIRVSVPDRKLREKVSVVPDGFLDFRMTLPSGKSRRKSIVVELDRGTTSVTPLKQKLRALYAMAVSEQYQNLFHTSVCLVAFVTTAGENRLRQLIAWCEEALTEAGLEDESELYLFGMLERDPDPQELFCSPTWYMPFVAEPQVLLWQV